VTPERPPNGADRVDGFMKPEGIFKDCDDFSEVEKAVASAFEELREADVLQMDDDGGATLFEIDIEAVNGS